MAIIHMLVTVVYGSAPLDTYNGHLPGTPVPQFPRAKIDVLDETRNLISQFRFNANKMKGTFGGSFNSRVASRSYHQTFGIHS
jgi:hypothetical protein